MKDSSTNSDLDGPQLQCEFVAEVLNTALQGAPANGCYWSVRTLAEETGISKSMVHRWFQLFHLQPHRQRHFKISNDPLFVDKVHDIVGFGSL